MRTAAGGDSRQVRVAWMGRLRTYRTLLRKVERLP